jgi:hypothetical protein
VFEARPARGGVAQSGLGPEAAHARAGARAEGHAPLDGGADQPGQDGGGLRERVGRDAVVGRLETATGEEAPHAGPDSGKDRCDVLVGRWRGGVEGQDVGLGGGEDAIEHEGGSAR